MYDIAIVGGGPAGSTLARLIGKKYKVLLLEKHSQENITLQAEKIDALGTINTPLNTLDTTITLGTINTLNTINNLNTPNTTDTTNTLNSSNSALSAQIPNSSNEKCCGGLLDPDAQLMLARFGLGIPKTVLLSPQLFAVRTIDIKNSVERYYQRHYINIDRKEFDKWLRAIIPPSVYISEGCVFKSYEEKNDCVLVKYRCNGRDYEENAKLLVGADGAFSKVRRQGFPEKPAPELYVSIQEWFNVKENQNCYGAIFDEDITDFYSWTIPKENQLILGTAIKPGADAHKKFELLKNKLVKYGYSFENSVRKNGAYLLRPNKLNQICTGKGRIALIGEAAGFISPSSAEGMSYAFKSSLALARALESAGLTEYEDIYHKNLGSLMRNISIKNLKSPAMYNVYLRKLIMKTGLMSLNIEND